MAYNSKKIHINFLIPLIGTTLLSIAGVANIEQVHSYSEQKYEFGSIDFSGRYIAALSDADFTSNNNDKYPRASRSAVDKLSIIPLPLNGIKRPSAQINISNAARSSIFPMATSPNGKIVFIIETLNHTQNNLNPV